MMRLLNVWEPQVPHDERLDASEWKEWLVAQEPELPQWVRHQMGCHPHHVALELGEVAGTAELMAPIEKQSVAEMAEEQVQVQQDEEPELEDEELAQVAEKPLEDEELAQVAEKLEVVLHSHPQKTGENEFEAEH
jgi:hypothetical protein